MASLPWWVFLVAGLMSGAVLCFAAFSIRAYEKDEEERIRHHNETLRVCGPRRVVRSSAQAGEHDVN